MKELFCLVFACTILGYIIALPTDPTYSHVRQQSPTAQTAPPSVGSDEPILYLQDPSLATQQPELESVFVKQLDNIKSAPQDDSIQLVRKSRKVQWEKGSASAATKVINGEQSKNKKDSNSALTVEKSDKNVKLDNKSESDDLTVEGEIGDSKTGENDLDKSNSFGFGFYGGGPWGGWGGGWGGPWGGWGGWGGGWGGWGGWGGPWGGFGPWG